MRGLDGFLGTTPPPQLQAVQPSPAAHSHRKSTSVREHTKSLSEAEKRRHKNTFSLIDSVFLTGMGQVFARSPISRLALCLTGHHGVTSQVPEQLWGCVICCNPHSVPWEADVTRSPIPPSTKPSCFWGQNRERKKSFSVGHDEHRVSITEDGRKTGRVLLQEYYCDMLRPPEGKASMLTIMSLKSNQVPPVGLQQ